MGQSLDRTPEPEAQRGARGIRRLDVRILRQSDRSDQMRQRSSPFMIGVTAAAAVTTALMLAATPQLRARDTIDVRVGAAPVPLAGSDGADSCCVRIAHHRDIGNRDVGLDRLEVFGDRQAKPLFSYGTNALEERVMRPGAERRIRYGRLVRRGTTAVVHVWMTLPNGTTAVPRILRNRLALSHDGVEVPIGDIRADVQQRASPVVLGSPLRGGLWLAHNGPGDHLAAHWGSVLVQNGRTTGTSEICHRLRGSRQHGPRRSR